MSDEYRVDFTSDEVNDMLKQQLTGPNKDLLAEAMVGLTKESSWKIQLLIKALMGVKPQPKLNLAETYVIKANDVSLYSADENAMKEAGLIRPDGTMLCKIKEFLPWENGYYKVRFNIINSSAKHKESFYDLPESYIKLAEEFPEDF